MEKAILKRLTFLAFLLPRTLFSGDFTSPPVTHLPMRSAEEMRAYATNKVGIIQVDTLYIAYDVNPYTNELEPYWHLLDSVPQGSFPYDPSRDGELGGAVQRAMASYLQSGAAFNVMKMVCSTNEQAVFGTFAGCYDKMFTWGQYFGCSNIFTLTRAGSDYVIPASASNATLVAGSDLDNYYPIYSTNRYLLVYLPGGVKAGHILSSRGGSSESWELHKGSAIDGITKLWIPMEIPGSGRTGRIIVRYATADPRIDMQQTFDLQTGDLMVPSGVRLELIRTTNSTTLCLAGKIPSANIAVETSSDLLHWNRIALFPYNGLAWCPVETSGSRLFYRAVAP